MDPGKIRLPLNMGGGGVVAVVALVSSRSFPSTELDAKNAGRRRIVVLVLVVVADDDDDGGTKWPPTPVVAGDEKIVRL